jgi:hypothetical protein
VPKVTTRSLYPECIANLKLPIDVFYRESRSGINIAKHNITTGLFGLMTNLPFFFVCCFKYFIFSNITSVPSQS